MKNNKLLLTTAYCLCVLFYIHDHGVSADLCNPISSISIQNLTGNQWLNGCKWSALAANPDYSIDVVNSTSIYSAKTGSLWLNQPFPLSYFQVDISMSMNNSANANNFDVHLVTGKDKLQQANCTQKNFLSSMYGLASQNFTGLQIVVSSDNIIGENVKIVYQSSKGDFTTRNYTFPKFLFRGEKNLVRLRIDTNNTLFVSACPFDGTIWVCGGTLTFQLPESITAIQEQLYLGVGAFISPREIGQTIILNTLNVYNCTPPETITSTLTSTTAVVSSTTVTATTTIPLATMAPLDSQLESRNSQKIEANSKLPSQTIQQAVYPNDLDDLNLSNITAADLLRECIYFAPNRAAPAAGANGAITWVKTSFAVDRFNYISTVDETMSISATLLLAWQVTTCPRNSQDTFTRRPLEQMYVASAKEVWTPGFRFISSEHSNIYMQTTDKFGEDLLATISYDQDNLPNRTLRFYWLKDGEFASACVLDLSKFPFDTQVCMIVFSLMRSTSLVQFEDPIFMWPEPFVNEEWTFAGKSSTLSNLRYKGLPVSTIYFSVALSRKPLYYVMNLVIPSAVLVLVNVFSFIMPPHEISRPGISVTVLLAVTFAQAGVIAQVPKTSSNILLADYTFALSWLSAAITLTQMATCWLATKSNHREAKEEATSIGKRNCWKKMPAPRKWDILGFSVSLLTFVAIHAYSAVVIINS